MPLAEFAAACILAFLDYADSPDASNEDRQAAARFRKAVDDLGSE